jgi:hypothetical protein
MYANMIYPVDTLSVVDLEMVCYLSSILVLVRWSCRIPFQCMVLNLFQNRNINIEVTDIEKVFKTLKYNKATGFDNIVYEHLKYGGNWLKWHMMNLFNLVSTNYYTPKPWKSSLIIPLFKGGSKWKDNLNTLLIRCLLLIWKWFVIFLQY